METNTAPAPEILALPGRASLTAVLLAPRWRLGRRSAARRAVEASAALWKPRVGRLLVAAQAAAAPALRAAACDGVLIVPASDSPLSAVACALDACAEDPLLLLDAQADVPVEELDNMVAALRPETAAVALVHPTRRLLPSPLLVRRAARPLVAALLDQGFGGIDDLMRRPHCRVLLLGS